MESPTEFLKNKYDLHKSPEVIQAAKRTEIRTGEKVPQDPTSRIENYLGRFEEIVNRKNLKDRERGLNALKQILHQNYVIKHDDVPESYLKHQVQILRERGQGGDWDSLSENEQKNVLKQSVDAIIADQVGSLDNWVDYLASNDAPYPSWFKYYAARNILNLGTYDKNEKTFPKRSEGTTKPFPELNREALSYVFDALDSKYTKKDFDLTAYEEADRKKFQEILKSENFAKLYSWAIEKVTPASKEALLHTEGKWVKYLKGSEPTELVDSLRGRGTGWCTAGEETARKQLQGGDFYVYYSNNQDGKPNIPRVAIRMEDNKIGEVRGIAENQNMDPYIGDVVQKKLEEFPDGKEYGKKVNDMKLLTDLYRKVDQNQELTKDELIFLYEINGKIEGFGYERDPRIQELRDKRNPKIDAPIILDCHPSQIAWSKDELNNNTKAYIGPLFPGFFDTHRNLEYIYTSFPEGEIRRESIGAGGKSVAELERMLEQNGIDISWGAQEMMESADFITLKSREVINLVYLNISDLGLVEDPTTDQIYERAQELGLELCPPEVGPELRFKYTNQPLGEWKYIAMKQISGSHVQPGMFALECNGDGRLRLLSVWTPPDSPWYSDHGLVFRLRK